MYSLFFYSVLIILKFLNLLDPIIFWFIFRLITLLKVVFTTSRFPMPTHLFSPPHNPFIELIMSDLTSYRSTLQYHRISAEANHQSTLYINLSITPTVTSILS